MYFTTRQIAKATAKPAFLLLLFSLGFGISQLPTRQMAVVAQESSPTFPLPTTVPSGTNLKLDGSTSMSVVNETFKQKFEGKFPGTQLNVATSTSDAALQALQEGKIDLAALGRSLTEAEKAQGFKPLVLNREKIAIILGPDNPFQGNITFAQFAKIFRGEITDWAELGGAPGPIRFIDRPNSSDTRLSLSRYKVFEDAPFQTGSTAKQVAQDDTASIIQDLGKDGISYAIASHVLNNDKIRIVPMHKTLPDDARYPYSQPRQYVYKTAADGSVSPAVQAFLGYASSPDGQQVLKEAQLAEAAAAGAAVAGAAALNASKPTDTASPIAASPIAASPSATSPSATSPSAISPTAASPTAASPAPDAAASSAAPTPVVVANDALTPNSYTPETAAGFPWWPLVPLLGIAGGGLLWWLKGRRESAAAPLETRELVGAGARSSEFLGTNVSSRTVPPTVPPAAVPPMVGRSPVGGAVEGNGAGVRSARTGTPITGTPITGTPATGTGTSTSSTPSSATSAKLPSNDGLGAAAALGGAAIAAGAGVMAVKGLKAAGNRIGIKEFGERSVYANWDLTPDSVAAAKQQGGKTMQMRVYDTTNLDLDQQTPQTTANGVQIFNCDESKQDKIVAVPHPGKDYVAEIGYATDDDRWLSLARSGKLQSVTIPGAGVAAGVGLAAGAAGAVAASKWGKTIEEIAIASKHPETRRYQLDGQAHRFVLNPGQASHLSDRVASGGMLQPGHYTVRIKEGQFGYRSLSEQQGEPFVLLWLKGQLTGLRTQQRVGETWLTLNGYQDEYKFQVHEPTKLHAFFMDTNVPDNDGEITLTVSRDS